MLHTGSPKPNDVWAFCELGGDNVVDKHRPLERAQILWQTLDGRRWTPPQLRTHVTLSDANGRLLPYMEEPYWKHNALQDLPDLTDAAANRAKSRLVTALGLMAGAEPREIVAAANDHGLVWVPLVSRHLLPEGHPEQRPAMFQHRSRAAATQNRARREGRAAPVVVEQPAFGRAAARSRHTRRGLHRAASRAGGDHQLRSRYGRG